MGVEPMIFSPLAAPAAGRGPPSRLEERLSHNLPIFIHGSIARLLLNTLLNTLHTHDSTTDSTLRRYVLLRCL
jgi:hypothetical protein